MSGQEKNITKKKDCIAPRGQVSEYEHELYDCTWAWGSPAFNLSSVLRGLRMITSRNMIASALQGQPMRARTPQFFCFLGRRMTDDEGVSA